MIESNYVKRLLKWFLKGKSTDIDNRFVLSCVFCEKGVLVVTDGFLIHVWNINIRKGTSAYTCFDEISKLDGLYIFEIHGKYLVVLESGTAKEKYPKYESICNLGKLKFSHVDWRQYQLEVARVLINPRLLKQLVSVPQPYFNNSKALLEIGALVGLRYDLEEFGSISALMMPMHFIDGAQTTIGPSMEAGCIEEIENYLDDEKYKTSDEHLMEIQNEHNTN